MWTPLLSLLAALPGLVLFSCGGATPGARGPDRHLAAYTGHAIDLFDDAIEPQAVGYSLEVSSRPKGDTLLRERTQVGDGVVLVRVVTVTSKQGAAGTGWQLGLHTLETLAGKRPPPIDFTLDVDARAPGTGVLRAMGGRLTGLTFVAFVREFARPNESDEGDLHFHLAGAHTDELEAVRSAALIDQGR